MSSSMYETRRHYGDGTAYWIPWLRVLVVRGLTCPPVRRFRMLSQGGSLAAYVETLDLLRPADRAGRLGDSGPRRPADPG